MSYLGKNNYEIGISYWGFLCVYLVHKLLRQSAVFSDVRNEWFIAECREKGGKLIFIRFANSKKAFISRLIIFFFFYNGIISLIIIKYLRFRNK